MIYDDHIKVTIRDIIIIIIIGIFSMKIISQMSLYPCLY